MKKNRVIIFGANGFIGSHLAHKLAKKGYETVAFIRKESELSPLLNENKDKLTIIKGNFKKIMVIG